MEFKYEGKSLKSGVYKITNILNGRAYYGSAKEFKIRWNQHKVSLTTNKHQNRFLQADFNKCGTDVFVFEVLEVIEGDRVKRLKVEEVYLKQYFDNGNQCYNLCNRAISREGYKNTNPSSKVRSKAFKKAQGEASKRMWATKTKSEKEIHLKKSLLSKRGWFKDSKHRPETMHLMKQKRKEQCAPGSLEHQRLVEYGLKKAKSVKLLDPNGIIHVVINISEFCRQMGYHKHSVIKLTNRKKPSYKGWTLA